MKTKTLIIALSILAASLFVGCDGTNPGWNLSNLPGPPPPAPPTNITWKAQPRAGLTGSIVFTFSDDPGDIAADDIDIKLEDTDMPGAIALVPGNSIQRTFLFNDSSPFAGVDGKVAIDIPDYTNETTGQKVVSGEQELTIYGTTTYYSIKSIGTLDAKDRETSYGLEFDFSADPEGLIPRDVGVLYPDDFSTSTARRNIVQGNNEGGPKRTLTLNGINPGSIIVTFGAAYNIQAKGAAGSNTATLASAPATFWCEVALDENGDPRGNLLCHLTRRIDTSNLQTSNLVLTGVTYGPTKVAGAARLTSMGPIDDRWGRTFGLNVTKTGDIVVQWRTRPANDPSTSLPDDANLGEIIDLEYVCEPFTVYK